MLSIHLDCSVKHIICDFWKVNKGLQVLIKGIKNEAKSHLGCLWLIIFYVIIIVELQINPNILLFIPPGIQTSKKIKSMRKQHLESPEFWSEKCNTSINFTSSNATFVKSPPTLFYRNVFYSHFNILTKKSDDSISLCI